MNTFGERLAYFIELVGMRPAEFSREVGYKRPDKIYHAIDNKFKLSLESLEDIAVRFPELNLDWLIRGDGEALKSKEPITVPKIEMNPNALLVLVEQQILLQQAAMELLRQQLQVIREELG